MALQLLGHVTMHCNAWRLPHTLTHSLTLTHTMCRTRTALFVRCRDGASGIALLMLYKNMQLKRRKGGAKLRLKMSTEPKTLRSIRSIRTRVQTQSSLAPSSLQTFAPSSLQTFTFAITPSLSLPSLTAAPESRSTCGVAIEEVRRQVCDGAASS
jgi:hypothetical protein